uniref:NADH-ubiquinone oxidoreductase chain 4L n=1 Tax=Oreophryne sp. TNHC-GDC 18615 TaxID=1933078 RepID=A0A343VTF1_9NEOB|nr:NADH dehydrogenase subunit 4L [Oreophryne sp. TNHC-GDC 18615]
MPHTLTTCFFIALTGFTFHRNRFLSALLCLEAMMLVIFLSLTLWPHNLSTSMHMAPIIVLTLSACEAALALSLMIAMARSHGTDKLKTLNLLRC